MCGDTIGATAEYYPTWVNAINPYLWMAHDAIAWSDTSSGSDPFVLNFFKDGAGNTLYVTQYIPMELSCR